MWISENVLLTWPTSRRKGKFTYRRSTASCGQYDFEGHAGSAQFIWELFRPYDVTCPAKKPFWPRNRVRAKLHPRGRTQYRPGTNHPRYQTALASWSIRPIPIRMLISSIPPKCLKEIWISWNIIQCLNIPNSTTPVIILHRLYLHEAKTTTLKRLKFKCTKPIQEQECWMSQEFHK